MLASTQNMLNLEKFIFAVSKLMKPIEDQQKVLIDISTFCPLHDPRETYIRPRQANIDPLLLGSNMNFDAYYNRGSIRSVNAEH